MAEATMVIKAAAVADYRPVNVSEQKLKRTGPLTLELAPTEDILAEVTKQRRPGQLIIGFAAETQNMAENGRAKLLRKGADAIVVNDVRGTAWASMPIAMRRRSLRLLPRSKCLR